MMKIIAYYLPQFHPFPENDEWWGKGFTEWTNVAKARPLFKGHDQPHIPRDLGFYDLRMPEVREAQAELAKEAGIYGFCYWHYWFGNGRRLLEKPLQEVVKTGKPDFPFCLGWANETWMAKVWNTENKVEGKILMEQLYSGKEDIVNHFNTILPIVSDKRYIRIQNRPVFVIYRPAAIPDFNEFKDIFNQRLRESGIAESFYFIAHVIKESEVDEYLAAGYDAVNMMRLNSYRFDPECVKANWLRIAIYKAFNTPLRLNYAKMLKFLSKELDKKDKVYPTILPNWDHTPRSGKKGCVFEHSTPDLFKKHVKQVLETIKNKPFDDQIVFLKSWNEWGEGNYMEPDLKWGDKYLKALKEVVSLIK